MKKEDLIIGYIYYLDFGSTNYIFMFEGIKRDNWISASYVFNRKFFTAHRETFCHTDSLNKITFATDEQMSILRDCIKRGDHVRDLNNNYPIY